MSPEAREALKREFAATYAAAVSDNAVTRVRLRGVKAVIVKKLGRNGLAEVEAEFMSAQETGAEAAQPEAAGDSNFGHAHDLNFNHFGRSDA